MSTILADSGSLAPDCGLSAPDHGSLAPVDATVLSNNVASNFITWIKCTAYFPFWGLFTNTTLCIFPSACLQIAVDFFGRPIPPKQTVAADGTVTGEELHGFLLRHLT